MKDELKFLLKKYKWLLLVEGLFLVINVFLYTRPVKYIGVITDLLYNIDENKSLIMQNIVWLLLSCITLILIRVVWKKIEFKVEVNSQKTLVDHLYKKFMKVRLEDINSTKNGEIMSYFVRDVKKTCRKLTRFYSTIIRVVCNLGFSFIMMSKSSNVKLSLCAFIPVIIIVISLIFIRKKLRASFFQAQQVFTEFSELVQESTDSIRTTKAFCGEMSEIENFTRKNAELKKHNIKTSYIEALLDILVNIGIGISYTIAILWGSNLVINSQMTTGNLVAFLGYLTILESPMIYLPWMISRIDELKISINRLDRVFKLQEEKIVPDNEKKNGEIISGDIEIKNLSFRYPESLEKALSNISVTVKRGEVLGIIGVVGSGKTTLMNLLLRLYSVDRGMISIGGKDINDIDPDVLRNSICYITQDNFLFSTSLKENINLFKNEYGDETIENSVKKAMIYDEISEMKDGIYTVIGEKGIDLSGGQKQRVVLSRAFLHNSEIVIFDDTFSALDNKTEQHVLNNIKELVKDKTCIIVSNRISDIKDCDKIIVMSQGEIVEQGNHKSLLAEGRNYYRFYNNQANKVVDELL